MDAYSNNNTCKIEKEVTASNRSRAFALNINFNILHNSSSDMEAETINKLKESVYSPENLISKLMSDESNESSTDVDANNEAEIKNNNINVLVNVI